MYALMKHILRYLLTLALKIYSNGRSEVILGNAIKKLGLPRDELVILTKVCVNQLGVLELD